jgi:hypothetical protein
MSEAALWAGVGKIPVAFSGGGECGAEGNESFGVYFVRKAPDIFIFSLDPLCGSSIRMFCSA